jgi:(2Fe-2S) ferredoxin
MNRRKEMEWKTKVVKQKRIKVTQDERFGMYRFGRWYTVIDLANNNKIIRHCRSYQEVEELIVKTGASNK